MAALLSLVVEPSDSKVAAEKFELVVQACLGPGFAFSYQKSKFATGPPSLTTGASVMSTAKTFWDDVQGLVHVSPAVPGATPPTRHPPAICACASGALEVPTVVEGGSRYRCCPTTSDVVSGSAALTNE